MYMYIYMYTYLNLFIYYMYIYIYTYMYIHTHTQRHTHPHKGMGQNPHTSRRVHIYTHMYFVCACVWTCICTCATMRILYLSARVSAYACVLHLSICMFKCRYWGGGIERLICIWLSKQAVAHSKGAINHVFKTWLKMSLISRPYIRVP